MTNYTKYGKNVIFCAPAQNLEQALRKESQVAAALKPGSVVSLDGDGKFAAGAGDVSYVLDLDHLGHQSVGDAYEADDRATAFSPEPRVILNVRVAASETIAEDAPLWAVSDGTVTAVDPTGTEVFGYAAEAVTTTAEQLVAVKFV